MGISDLICLALTNQGRVCLAPAQDLIWERLILTHGLQKTTTLANRFTCLASPGTQRVETHFCLALANQETQCA